MVGTDTASGALRDVQHERAVALFPSACGTVAIGVLVSIRGQRNVERARLRLDMHRKVDTRNQHTACGGEPEHMRIRLPGSGVSRHCGRMPICKPFVEHRAAHAPKARADDA